MTIRPAIWIAMCCLAAFATPADAQLFGGGGLLGGGGGGLLGGGGGGGFGGGGFGGGPGFGGGGLGGRPILGGGAPIMRPSLPAASPRPAAPVFGVGRPIASPAPGLGNRPLLDRPIADRPAAGLLPSGNRPLLGDRPIIGNRPQAGNLPAVNRLPAIDPPALPGAVRPDQPINRDRLNEFLSGTDRPAAGTLPSESKPEVGNPIDGPGADRPIGGGRPTLDRPIVEQPIMPNLGEQVLRDEVRKEIVARRVERAVKVRDRIRELYYRENHPFVYWWHYMWNQHPVWSWWRVTAPYRWASWSSVSSWCGYSGQYAQPVTYEYTDQGIYANGKQVVVDDAYTKQARELAAAGAQLLQQKIDAGEANQLEWLPLGVFALCKPDGGDPTMFLQLAISREGIVAGSFANTTNNENLSVQGAADRESTRLAVTIGDVDDVVVETCLYNMTEQQSSALLHYQDGARESWVLVKMPDPQGKQAN